MTEEGYIKYACEWTPGPGPDPALVQALNHWRSQAFERGWIGWDPSLNVGYGNVSMRVAANYGLFLISGTQTGRDARLRPDQYTLVTEADLAGNRLKCEGPLQASSESLSHWALYAALPEAQSVFHIHHGGLWHAAKNVLPCTPESAAYGSPEMGFALQALCTAYPGEKVLVMGGHTDGLIAWGESPERVFKALGAAFVQFSEQR